MEAFGLEGRLGFALVDLALVAAAVSAVALGWAAIRPSEKTWARLGLAAFGVHVAAVLGTLALLLTLLITHRFEYHYVWSHSSHELPLYFVLACLWEGQEGSFLTWMVWHAVLGVAVWATAPAAWRAPVLAVMASVQAILASMILGAWLPPAAVGTLLALVLGGLAFVLWRQAPRLVAVALVAAMALALTNLLTDTAGLWQGGASPALVAQSAVWLVAMGLFGASWLRGGLSLSAAMAGVGALILTAVILVVPNGGWQLGSSPFLLLREAMPDQEVFASNPTFIPPNGRGLNALLQNYWMVIHPPTLFLGFALTLVPFAFVAAGLLTRRPTEWLRPSAPWLVASVAVLGIGIMMGGYWAYETLNFGGYWNWDPVENASLAPWLTGIAGLHLTLAYRHGRAHLRGAVLLIIATFLLVLYSTFLTRSGVLGDASVHSFTDLGLSGQLVVLLFAYVVSIIVLLRARWDDIPTATSESPLLSRDTFLLGGALVLTLAALQISLTTSLPVANKLFGTSLAPSGKIQYFYYQWNVWVGIAIAALSAVGQFLFWRRMAQSELLNAIFRPFAAAALAAIAVMLTLAFARWSFVYEPLFVQAESQGVAAAVGTFALRLADELLLFAALFTVLANLDILWGMVRRRGRQLLSTGGALAHIGFGLMLLGILFSSGYEQTVSVNFSPGELGAQFPEQERLDNVLLVQQQPKYLRDYRVIYRGKAQAVAPISRPEVLFEDAGGVKLAFADATGERFGLELPTGFFDLPEIRGLGLVRPVADSRLSARLDREALRQFIERNLAQIRPQLLNGRKLYTLEFAPLDAEKKMADTTRGFVLYPEAEVNENLGLVLHPDRYIRWDHDLYVYVSSIPASEADNKPDTTTRRMKITEWRVNIGDTLRTSRGIVVLDSIVRVEGVADLANADLVVRAKLRVLAGGLTYRAAPTFIIEGNDVRHRDDRVERLGLQFSFAGVNPKANHVVIQVGEEQATDDFVTIKAIKKPWINLLWLGTLVLALGFGVALVRRGREARAATLLTELKADENAGDTVSESTPEPLSAQPAPKP